MNLTKNFTLEELTASSTAKSLGINNAPDPISLENLQRLATEVLQPIRNKYGHSIIVSSGYRCPKLNSALKSASKTSQHLKGQAADIYCTATSKAELFNLIKGMIQSGELKVGQLIWEYGDHKNPRWIHVSLPYTKTNQILYFYDKA